MFYAIVEKDTGRMEFGRSNFYSMNDLRPINEDELAVVPLNQELTDLLTHTDHEGLDLKGVDFEKSYYDFTEGKWILIYQENISVDPVEQKIVERQELINNASIKLRIPDLPDALRLKITKYIEDLENINITSENCRDTVFPFLEL